MGVRTMSPLVEECRRGVMEFTSHQSPPRLPDLRSAANAFSRNSCRVRPADSRFLENKVKNPRYRARSARYTSMMSAGILCSRCIRFARRSRRMTCSVCRSRQHSVLTAHPEALGDNYSLTRGYLSGGSAHFIRLPIQDARLVLKERKVSARAARPDATLHRHARRCHLSADARENDAVNSCWMCDTRLNFNYLQR